MKKLIFFFVAVACMMGTYYIAMIIPGWLAWLWVFIVSSIIGWMSGLLADIFSIFDNNDDDIYKFK